MYKKPNFLPEFFPNLFGFVGYFTWKSAYWSMQLTMRNRVQLTWAWLFNGVFGRELTRMGKESTPMIGTSTSSANAITMAKAIKDRAMNAAGSTQPVANANATAVRRVHTSALRQGHTGTATAPNDTTDSDSEELKK